MKIRVGFGFDVHQLVAGRELWLGGIRLEHEKGLLGHSDADVLIHTICDALLGAANMRDIGYHFPDTAGEFKNIDSKILLKKTIELIAAKGYLVGNIDATICAERPKLKSYIPEMQRTLAAVMGIDEDDISIKATTTEKLGFTGRNGRGKTTFLRLLLGEFPYQGTISASVPFSYFPFSVKRPESLAIEAAEKMNPTYEFWRLQREMARLRLDEAMLYRPYATLSGGEQTKLQLAVLFSSENNFLLIDEPTNHLDLQGRELVSRYLDQKHGFLLVSHDRAFLDGCVDHILSINRADIQVSKGNFSTWMENRERQDAFEQRQNEKLLREISRLKETAREKSQWAGTPEDRQRAGG